MAKLAKSAGVQILIFPTVYSFTQYEQGAICWGGAYDPVGQERGDLESKEGLRTKVTKMRDES